MIPDYVGIDRRQVSAIMVLPWPLFISRPILSLSDFEQGSLTIGTNNRVDLGWIAHRLISPTARSLKGLEGFRADAR
jgi:hypothetical protein